MPSTSRAGPRHHRTVRVVVAGSGLSWSGAGFVAGLPVALGALVIAVLTIGPLATVVAIVIGVPLAFLVLEGIARMARARAQGRSQAPGVVFAAEATQSGKAGIVTVSEEAIEWRDRRSGQPSITVPLTRVVEVEVRPIRLLFFQAARITVKQSDGEDIKLAVTAPAKELRAALLAVAPD